MFPISSANSSFTACDCRPTSLSALSAHRRRRRRGQRRAFPCPGCPSPPLTPIAPTISPCSMIGKPPRHDQRRIGDAVQEQQDLVLDEVGAASVDHRDNSRRYRPSPLQDLDRTVQHTVQSMKALRSPLVGDHDALLALRSPTFFRRSRNGLFHLFGVDAVLDHGASVAFPCSPPVLHRASRVIRRRQRR